MNFHFFVYFLQKGAKTFNKFQCFTFDQKRCIYLTHSIMKCLEKSKLKKGRHLTLDGHISRTRTNLESRLRLQKVHLLFFKIASFLASCTHVVTRLLGAPPKNSCRIENVKGMLLLVKLNEGPHPGKVPKTTCPTGVFTFF